MSFRSAIVGIVLCLSSGLAAAQEVRVQRAEANDAISLPDLDPLRTTPGCVRDARTGECRSDASPTLPADPANRTILDMLMGGVATRAPSSVPARSPTPRPSVPAPGSPPPGLSLPSPGRLPASVPSTSGADGLRAVRAFGSDDTFPPRSYAGYAVLVFGERLDPTDAAMRTRWAHVCGAYLAFAKSADLPDVPDGEKVVTIWPLKDAALATELNRVENDADCDVIIDGYHRDFGRERIRDARRAYEGRGGLFASVPSFDGRGPFLFAWAPGEESGKSDVPVLALDMSRVRGAENFRRLFRWYEREVEQHPERWNRGFKWVLTKARLDSQSQRIGAVLTSFLPG